MFARPFILALSIATIAFAQPTTAPSLHALVDRLANRDPAIREQARDKLMQLTRGDLPALAEAARGRRLMPTQMSLLHEVVVQVYLTGKHDFAGDGSGYLGITAPASVAYSDDQGDADIVADAQGANGQPPPDENAEPPTPSTRRGAVVQSRTVGCDAYRVLQVGDVITAVSRPNSGEKDAGTPSRITGFNQLRSALAGTRTGEWVVLRILRNGAEMEVRARLARKPTTDEIGNVVSEVPEGERYWDNTFRPAMADSPTSGPATRRTKGAARASDERKNGQKSTGQ